MMRSILLLSLFISSFILPALIFGCDNSSTSLDFKKQISRNKEECVEPQNPYNDDGGHSAGFNWANENGGDCNGDSTSFNEGCEEYFMRLERYNQCVARGRK